jgi:hypothetical protein
MAAKVVLLNLYNFKTADPNLNFFLTLESILHAVSLSRKKSYSVFPFKMSRFEIKSIIHSAHH